MKGFILVIFGVIPFLTNTSYALWENDISLEDSEVANVTSPNYPNDYEINTDIRWRVIAPPGYRVMLHFVDLHIDDGLDYVTVYEGRMPEFEQAVQRIRISGFDRPPNITSAGSYLWLQFTSDAESNDKGFNALLSYIHIRDIFLTLVEAANITSPNYPNQYDDNADILWKVTAPSGYRVVLQFKNFTTQQHKDNVTVFEGRAPEFEKSVMRIRESGSTIPSNITSVGSYLWLRFISDEHSMLGTHTGFSAQLLLADIPVIDLTLTETANLTSPQFPNQYDNNTDDLWKVKAPTGNRVVVTFVNFNTENGNDFVTLFEGRSPDFKGTTERKKLSGNPRLGSYTSIGSYMWLRFTSDGSNGITSPNHYTGFRALLSYATITGILLTTSRTTNLTSPRFPRSYVSDTDILWKVIAPSGERVMVTFSAFDTELGYDFVAIYEGQTNDFEEAVERSKLSGSSLPDNITSIGSYVWLRFTSAGEDQSCALCSGFMAMIGTVPIRETSRLRLVSGRTPNEGRVEVNVGDGRGWGTICDNGWDYNDASVVCKQIGYPAATFSTLGARFGGNPTLPMLLENVACTPSHTTIDECPADIPSASCDHTNDAGVKCMVPDFLGCFSLLTIGSRAWTILQNSNDACKAHCKDRDYRYAGMSGTSCRCGNNRLYYLYNQYTDYYCNSNCKGDATQLCGNSVSFYFSVFDTTLGVCEDPGDPQNGNRTGDDFAFGATIEFTCLDDHVLTGDPILQCVLGNSPHDVRWSGNLPECVISTSIQQGAVGMRTSTIGDATIDPMMSSENPNAPQNSQTLSSVVQSTPPPTTVADTSPTTTTSTSEVTSTIAVGILLAFVTLYGIIITLVYLHLRRSNIALKQSVSAREGQRLDPYTSLDPTTMEHPAYDDTIATTRGDIGQMNAIEGVEYGNQRIVEHPYTSLDATTMEQPAYDDTIATTRGDRGQMNAIEGVEYRNQTIVEQTARVQQSILRVADENTEPEYVLPI